MTQKRNDPPPAGKKPPPPPPAPPPKRVIIEGVCIYEDPPPPGGPSLKDRLISLLRIGKSGDKTDPPPEDADATADSIVEADVDLSADPPDSTEPPQTILKGIVLRKQRMGYQRKTYFHVAVEIESESDLKGTVVQVSWEDGDGVSLCRLGDRVSLIYDAPEEDEEKLGRFRTLLIDWDAPGTRTIGTEISRTTEPAPEVAPPIKRYFPE